MSGPRVDGLSDDAGLTPLLDDNPVQPALDDVLGIGQLVALEHEEPARMLPDPLVVVHRERDDGIALERGALAAELRRVLLAGPQPARRRLPSRA